METLNEPGDRGEGERQSGLAGRPVHHPSRLRRRLVVIAAVVLGLALLGLFFVLALDRWTEASSASRISSRLAEVPEHRVALVLGAMVYPDGRLSAMLHDRVAAAVRLYKAGKVEKLLMSGDNSQSRYDEVTAMRNAAIRMGVPSDDVVRDFAGFRTWDSLYRAREIWGLKDLVIVTQRFHLPRALFIARGLGIDAHGYVADRPGGYPLAGRRSRLREIPARFLAWLDVYVLKPGPHFLGPPEGLSGDAQREN